MKTGRLASWFYFLACTFFSFTSLLSQALHETREKELDKQILELYADLSSAKALLSQESVRVLPANTTISFLGSFPNRTGLRVSKYYIESELKDKSKLKSSEEKSILLEFNGSTLSKVEISIVSEDTQIQSKTRTTILDNTPLDTNLNDMVIRFQSLEGTNQFLLSDLTNDDIKHERNNFKKDFYTKLLLDFHAQISTILAMQKNETTSKQKKVFKELQGSLKY